MTTATFASVGELAVKLAAGDVLACKALEIIVWFVDHGWIPADSVHNQALQAMIMNGFLDGIGVALAAPEWAVWIISQQATVVEGADPLATQLEAARRFIEENPIASTSEMHEKTTAAQ